MSERKVNLHKIIRDKWQYRLEEVERKVIRDIAKEACRQVLELAAENAEVKPFYYDNNITVVNKQSILNTINQVE